MKWSIGRWWRMSKKVPATNVISIELKTLQEYWDQEKGVMNKGFEERIAKIKADYEKQISYITEEKVRHPENGEDLDLWKRREEIIYYDSLVREEYFRTMTIRLNQDNIDLREEIIFLKYELKKYIKDE